KAKLTAVKDELLTARAESQKERRATLEEVIAQVKSDRLDEAKLAQLIEQHQAERTRMMQRVLPKVSDWHASLRPEQKADAAKLIQRWTDHSPWNKMDPAE
ncbi:MAG: Spy/CpxP family protein refolding chaperone, partial [Nitrospira sp.]